MKPTLGRLARAALGPATLAALAAHGGLAGCGRETARPALEATSHLDAGPRAVEDPVDAALAEEGGRLYGTVGCVACHVQSGRAVPDLVGVSRRRSARWLEQFILHPEVMVRQDPIGRELMHEYTIQMPNFELTPEQARAVIEYFKLQDRGSARIARVAR